MRNKHLGYNAQKWLEQNYPQGQKVEFRILFLRNKDLAGKLTIEGYEKVESIHCEYNNKLESVKLVNLPELVSFNANGCSLRDIIIKDCPKITKFNLGNNLLESTEFLK